MSKEFESVMDIVLDKSPIVRAKGVKSSDFLPDLTDNLGIMYKEGGRYYFIHRSFQEYFTAVYFANDYDENLWKAYYNDLKSSTEKKQASYDLFDD